MAVNKADSATNGKQDIGTRDPIPFLKNKKKPAKHKKFRHSAMVSFFMR